eukprot:m.13187 g.13187  ORF g.13187 m.13187 type:complete len:764 (-) comp8035_c0_seq2:71-2362(-)
MPQSKAPSEVKKHNTRRRQLPPLPDSARPGSVDSGRASATPERPSTPPGSGEKRTVDERSPYRPGHDTKSSTQRVGSREMSALGPRVRRVRPLPEIPSAGRKRERNRRMSTLLDDCQRHRRESYSVDYLRALFAQLIHYIVVDRMTESTAFETVTVTTHLAPTAFKKGNMLRELWEAALRTGSISEAFDELAPQVPETKGPTTEDARFRFPLPLYAAIADVAEEWRRGGVKMQAPRLQRWLERRFGVTPSRRQCHRLIRNIVGVGYGTWPKGHRCYADRSDDKRDFVVKSAYVELLEGQGWVMRVFWDETWINEGHDTGSGWGDQEHGNEKGRRLCLIHALTEGGLVCGMPSGTPQSEWTKGTHFKMKRRQPSKAHRGAPKDKGRIPLSAEWVWQCNAKIKDAHKTMDTDTLMYWFENQLVPAVEAMYPEGAYPNLKGFVHIIDNAPYHWGVGTGGIPTGTLSKKQMAETGEKIPAELPADSAAKHGSNFSIVQLENIFVTLGIVSIIVKRPRPLTAEENAAASAVDDVHAGSVPETMMDVKIDYGEDGAAFWARAPMGPYVEELRTALHSALRASDKHCHRLMTRLQRSCWDTVQAVKDGKRRYWHRLLFTVPYWAATQPAELVWATSKGRTGCTWYPHRDIDTLLEHWLTSMYGGTVNLGVDLEPEFAVSDTWSSIDAAEIKSYIRHSRGEMNEFIATNTGLFQQHGEITTFDELKMWIPMKHPNWMDLDTIDDVLRSFLPRREHQIEFDDLCADEDDGSA